MHPFSDWQTSTASDYFLFGGGGGGGAGGDGQGSGLVFAVTTSVDGGDTMAGSAFTVTVTAEDVDGHVVPDYRGTVHFTSADSQANLPADYTFASADNGTHTFSVTLYTAGRQSVTVTDTNRGTSGTANVNVQAGPAVALNIFGPSVAVTGMPFQVTVSAYDAWGNFATGYRGTIHFTSTDGSAGLPADYTYSASDAGRHTFYPVTLNTPGTQSVGASDEQGLFGSVTIAVYPGGSPNAGRHKPTADLGRNPGFTPEDVNPADKRRLEQPEPSSPLSALWGTPGWISQRLTAVDAVFHQTQGTVGQPHAAALARLELHPPEQDWLLLADSSDLPVV